MRTLLVMALVVGAIAAGNGTAAPPDPFAGAWLGTDVDGSNVRLQISMDADGVRRVAVTDDRTFPTGPCGGAPARWVGTGTVSGDTLTALTTVRCKDFVIPFFPLTIVALPSGELTIFGIVVVSRQGGA